MSNTAKCVNVCKSSQPQKLRHRYRDLQRVKCVCSPTTADDIHKTIMASKNEPPLGFVANPQQYPPMQPPPAYRTETPPPPYPPQDPLKSPPSVGYQNTTSHYGATHQVHLVDQEIDRSGEVSDHLILSVISIFFCCILGVIATVKAVDAREAKRRGDNTMASSFAKSAKNLAITAIALGCVLATISFVANVFAVGIHW